MTNHLDSVFDSFLGLFDGSAKNTLAAKAYFAGGCIYCLANDKPVKDYDLFLLDRQGCGEIEKLDLWKCKTEYALSRGKYQVVTKYYGTPDKCVGQFDFKHNMYFYKPHGNSVESACGEFDSLFTNELIFNESRARDIEGVYLRIERFVQRGFVATPEMIAKIKRRTTNKKINEYAKKLKNTPRRHRY